MQKGHCLSQVVFTDINPLAKSAQLLQRTCVLGRKNRHLYKRRFAYFLRQNVEKSGNSEYRRVALDCVINNHIRLVLCSVCLCPMSDKKDSSRPEPQFHCRVCGAQIANQTDHQGPFCSARCRMQDLSKWFGENYRIAASPADVPKMDGEPDDLI